MDGELLEQKEKQVIVGDSWFASVKSAVRVSKGGRHFIGNVKTATMMYPKKWFG